MRINDKKKLLLNFIILLILIFFIHISGSIVFRKKSINSLAKKLIKEFFIFLKKNIDEFYFKESNPLRIESNSIKQLHLECNGCQKAYIKYKSSHPDIIKINNEGIVYALRPGKAIIIAYGLDIKNAKLEVIAISNKGLINLYTLHMNNAELYQNVMIVAHPDDETLWGGANLFKDSYFVVCLTNGYHLKRSRDFKQILNFTNNSGIILNYPDYHSNQSLGIDNWEEVENGIIRDLSIIVSYKNWNKIVTHGPEGTTGHIHHKIISKIVTKLTKKFNKYNNLYYFGKFYKKNEIPKYLPRISENELEVKKKEVYIYESVRGDIYRLWFHFLPYENWILASKWKKSYNI